MTLGSIATLPVGAQGVDAFTLPAGATIAAGGYKFASCYLANPDIPKQVPKILTPSKRDDLAAAGLGLMLNWEGSAGDPLQGRSLGQWHGAYAERLANSLQAPVDLHIVISCDVNISPANWAACDAYWSGFAGETQRPLGAYVESDYMEHLDAEGLASLFWWPAAASWSNGRISSLSHVQQLLGYVLGGTCDANVLLRETPFWYPHLDKPLEPDVIIPAPPLVEEDMPIYRISYGDIPGLDGDGAVYELVGGARRHVSSDEWTQVLKGVAQNRDGSWAAHEFWQPTAPVANGWVLTGMPVYTPGATAASDCATKTDVDQVVRAALNETELTIDFRTPGV